MSTTFVSQADRRRFSPRFPARRIGTPRLPRLSRRRPAPRRLTAGEKKICKQLPSSSSRLPQRVCLTEKQWKHVEPTPVRVPGAPAAPRRRRFPSGARNFRESQLLALRPLGEAPWPIKSRSSSAAFAKAASTARLRARSAPLRNDNLDCSMVEIGDLPLYNQDFDRRSARAMGPLSRAGRARPTVCCS